MSRFAACVKKMAKRAGVKSPRAVCAAIGRQKYGQAGMTALAAAGRRKNKAADVLRYWVLPKGQARGGWQVLPVVRGADGAETNGAVVETKGTKREAIALRDKLNLALKRNLAAAANENPWKGPTICFEELHRRRGLSGQFDTAAEARAHKAAEYPHNSQMVVTAVTTKPGGGLMGYYVVDKRPSLYLANAPRRWPPLSADKQAWVDSVLANDESSTDAELVKHFTENGLSLQQARAAVRLRTKMLNSLGRRRRRRNPKNPAAAAKEAYELTHGRPSTSEIKVTKKVRHHEHLADWGELVELVIKAENGATVTLSDFDGTRLAMNEARTQLFVVGGDQSLDLEKFGLAPGSKELYVLGALKKCAYYTVKDHLGDEGGEATYVHEHGELWKRRPTVLYDEPNEQILLAGGVYTMPAKGITD